MWNARPVVERPYDCIPHAREKPPYAGSVVVPAWRRKRRCRDEMEKQQRQDFFEHSPSKPRPFVARGDVSLKGALFN
jgi:hypothetical protein